jgi:hypothetical protein
MKRDVLLVAPIFAPTLPRLNADYVVHRLRDAPDAIPNYPLRRVAKPRHHLRRASRDLIDRLPQLRLIAC